MRACYFCEKEAITKCCDCGKPLCKDHKYAPLGDWSQDRCPNHNAIHIAKTTGKGVSTTVKATFKTINYLGKLWGR